jgi:dolichol-phosphate mannosyltransferase
LLNLHFGKYLLLKSRNDALTSGPLTTGNFFFFITGQLLLVRLLGSASFNLITEEAYYWKYAENLSYGYLDHPPLVAWSIALGEKLFGTNEFGVRSIGHLYWCGILFFAYKLTKECFPKVPLSYVVVVCTLLPFTLSAGFLMTPDTPMSLAWIGALYFLHLALVRTRESAWIPAGILIGCALLGKYPAVLLGVSAVTYMVVASNARQWFLHPLPYLAVILTAAVFSPVILWNYQHDWASFAFQSTRRFSEEQEFGLHLWVLFTLITLTPPGVVILYRTLRESISNRTLLSAESPYLFIAVFSLVPIFAFGYASLSQEVKVNWLGPASLVCIPLFSKVLFESVQNRSRLIRGWLATGIVISLSLHVILYALVVGIPGAGTPKALRKFTGWEDLARIVEQERRAIAEKSGTTTIVAGGDSHYVSSELGFYGSKLARLGAFIIQPPTTEGRSLFNNYSLMFQYWSVPAEHIGDTILIVSRSEGDMSDQKLARFFSSMEPAKAISIVREGKVAATFFLRVGYGYRLEELGEGAQISTAQN